MILDAQLRVSNAQALMASAGSTDYIDLGIDRNIFDGKPMAVMIQVSVAADFTSANETYAFSIECDDNTSFSSATSLCSRTITAAVLAVNTVHVLPIPAGQNVERYLRVYYTLGGTTPLVTVSAYLVPMDNIQKYRVYADAITIS